MAPTAAAPSRRTLVLRIAVALLGGYAFAWGFIAAGLALGFAAGMDFHDAEFVASALGLLVFLAAFLWTFAARRLWPVAAVLVAGAAALAGLASVVQSRVS